VKKYKIKSYCKINLSLKVLKRLNSGYHNITSLITFCNLHDEILISKIKGFKDKISFSGKFSAGIDEEKNTVTKVLNLLRNKRYLNNQNFKINIKKNIPHGSGLGGGSSNAAVILKYLNFKMKLKFNKSELIKLASQIGFDVPICLEKKNTFLTGNKKKFLRLNQKFGLNILIVYPNLICQTKKIYKENKKFTLRKQAPAFKIKNKIIEFLKEENNDLEKAVVKFHPKVKEIIDSIKAQNGCYFSRITGSGSACIGIFSNKETANYARKLMKLKYPKYWFGVSKTM